MPWNWREVEFEPVEAVYRAQSGPTGTTGKQDNIAAITPVKGGMKTLVAFLSETWKNITADSSSGVSNSQSSTE